MHFNVNAIMRQYAAFLLIVLLFGAHALWSNLWLQDRTIDSVNSAELILRSNANSESYEASAATKVQLLEWLDRVIVYENAFYAAHGSYTRLLSKLEIQIPKAISHQFSIQIRSQSPEVLEVIAISEDHRDRVKEMIRVDQDFQVRANFQLALPSQEYLRLVGLRYLRQRLQTPNSTRRVSLFGELLDFNVNESGKKNLVLQISEKNTKKKALTLAIDRQDSAPLEFKLQNYLGLMAEIDLQSRQSSSEVVDSSLSNDKINSQRIQFMKNLFLSEIGRVSLNDEELSQVFLWKNSQSRIPAGEAVAPQESSRLSLEPIE